MDMELVSVIIPIYNVEDQLDRCIASVVGQTYQNLEIILIDDGSTDCSPEICDCWANKDSRIISVHQSNSGVSAARNAGLKTASGEWILQVDSDDYIAPNTVEVLLRAAMKTNAEMVICDFVKGTENQYRFQNEMDSQTAVVDSEEAISRIYLDSHNALRYVVPWCKLCKRSLFEGICYPDGKIFEDIYTTHKLLDRCERIAVVNDILFYYYQRLNSIMNAVFSMKKLDYLQALVERVDFFKDHDMEALAETAYDELLHSLIWEYSRTRDLLHSEEGKRYVKELFRSVYRKGYASKRYPDENKRFLAAFNTNPEWIILYWRIKAKADRIIKRKG